ncbi:MAG TPA: TIGR03118 family protein [Candidatus Eisenbacteria bacterium]|nr:TIGR03118 family protein [Candidatus Eisenbacteria bacterium]
MTTTLFRRGATLLIAIPLALWTVAQPVMAAERGLVRGAYLQTNLVSNIPKMAQVTDPNLKNPWGLSSSPASPIWAADNNAGVSTLYSIANGAATPVPLVVQIPAPGNVPGGAPTGTVFSGSSGFVVSKDGKSGSSLFLFATEDGTIVGWNPGVDRFHGILAVDNSAAVDSVGDVGAVYKGLAIDSASAGTRLYAANFRFATVDVFDSTFTPVKRAGSFSDPGIPAGFAPFGIQNLGGQLYVTYAKQNAAKHDDVKGLGNGYVDVYDLNGNLLRRFASQGTLNSPWGLAIAPSTFGHFHDDLLVGNFGDGRINGFDLASGTFTGQLGNGLGGAIQIDGLWGLRVGNGGRGGDPNFVYFAAGINDEADGLFGSIQTLD